EEDGRTRSSSLQSRWMTVVRVLRAEQQSLGAIRIQGERQLLVRKAEHRLGPLWSNRHHEGLPPPQHETNRVKDRLEGQQVPSAGLGTIIVRDELACRTVP